jgi:zinc transporter 1/2/3
MTTMTSFDHDHDHTHALSSHYNDPKICEMDGDCMYDNGHSHSHSHSHSLSISTATGGGEVASEIVLVKAFIMEIAIAAHSIIIGVTFGAIGIEETLVALLIAMSFHQFFEGLALGTVVASARKQLGEAKVAAFVIVFSLTTPIGIAIGMLALETDGEPTENQVYAQGILNAIAAGNLIYIVLVEMMSHDFSLPSVAKNIPLRLAMLAALCCGDLFMAVLALWA